MVYITPDGAILELMFGSQYVALGTLHTAEQNPMILGHFDFTISKLFDAEGILVRILVKVVPP
ncbi:MAG: hypothetical protein AB7N80_12055, partial [Bdellovibrionales bacterium]